MSSGLLRANNCSTSELLMSLHLSESASSVDKDLQFNILHSGPSAILKCGENDQNVKRVETCVDNIIAKNLDFLNTSLNQSNLIIRESQSLLITKQQCINHLIQVERDIKEICVDRQTCGAYYDYICLSGKKVYSDIMINNTILYSDLFSELFLPTMTVGEIFISPIKSSLYEPPVSNQTLNLSRSVLNKEEKLSAQNFTLSIKDNIDSSNAYLITTNKPSTPATQVLFNLFANNSYQVENSEKRPPLEATTLVSVKGNSPQVTITAASLKNTTELPKYTQTTKTPIVLTTEKIPILLLATTTIRSDKSTPELPKVTQATTKIALTIGKPSALLLTTKTDSVKSTTQLSKVTQTKKIPISLITEKPSTSIITTTNSWKSEKPLPKEEQTTIKTPVTDTEISAQPIWVQSMMSAFMQIGMTQIDTLSVKLTNLKSDTSCALDELKRAESMLQSMDEDLINFSFDNSLSNIEEQIKQIINNKYTYDVTCTGRSNATKNFTTTVSKGKVKYTKCN